MVPTVQFYLSSVCQTRMVVDKFGEARTARKVVTWLVIAAAMLLTLVSWAFASPVGSSPDDDFHLTSIYCASDEAAFCQEGAVPGYKKVPVSLLQASCFAGQEKVSAGCQTDLNIFSSTATPETTRGNFYGQYPGVFYSTMALLATPDVQTSVLAMRVANALIFTGISALVICLVPRSSRKKIALVWLASLVPLGLFIIPSTNPSSWAVMAVPTAFIALFFSWKATGWRRVLLNLSYVLAVLLAVGARSDAAIFALIAGVAALAVQKPLSQLRSWWLMVPVFATALELFVFLRSGQTSVLSTGFSTSGQAPTHSATEIFFGNILNLPSLWLGAFGSWGLGWLDTAMPAIVWIAAGSTFGILLFSALKSATRRELLVAGGIVAGLVVIPLYILQKSLAPVGAEVQPRYVLPLLALLAAVSFLAFSKSELSLRRVQWVLLAGFLAVSHSVALYINLRRYVMGSQGGPNLDASPEWWWNIPVGPMTVWAVGSIAFALCTVLVVRLFITERPHVSVS